MCKCTNKEICKIAKIYAEDLNNCFQEFETMEVYAYNFPDWLEIYQFGLRGYRSDIVVYDFDANENKGICYFDFYRINESRLSMLIYAMINTFFEFSANDANTFIDSLQIHGVAWTI